MDQAAQENNALKRIIRENDSRIHYLERKLDSATDYINYLEQCLSESWHPSNALHKNKCYSCGDTYLHDEISCDCNMFCSRALCKSCFQESKKDVSKLHNTIQLCRKTNCNIWNCERKGSIYQCKGCDTHLCVAHYHNINVDLKNWICIECCEKIKTDYGYESV